MMNVEVLILQHNQSEMTARCLDSVFAQDYENLSVTLVDNGSDPGHLSISKRYPVRLIALPENIGFVRGMNVAWERSSADVVCLLNNDTILATSTIKRLVRALHIEEAIGWVSAVYQQGNFWQHCIREFPDEVIRALPGNTNPLNQWSESLGQLPELTYWNRTEVTCVCIPKTTYQEIGYLDDNLIAGRFEVDYGMRLGKIGQRLAVCRNAVFWHDPGHPTLANLERREKLVLPALVEMDRIMRHKWGDEYQASELPVELKGA
jgi:GT2 family glycosyltransferase